ncbi:MAG: lytic murein transglycosylase [Thiothrix sp.]
MVVVLVIGWFANSVIPDPEFEAWKIRFSQLAKEQGVSAEVATQALQGFTPDYKVLRLEAHQPEFTKPVWEYLESAVSAKRIAQGQVLLQEKADLLQRIYQQYGVQPEYLLAIWGVESNFGRQTGDYNVIRSLATLAYAGIPERRVFWQAQLFAALRLLEKGDIPLAAMRGSWAGAMGHTQFIPTTFEEFAVDFDGDGKRDLINSTADALASTANYLMRSGWQRDKPWGREVRLPANFDWSSADPDVWLPAQVWGQRGVSNVDNQQVPTELDPAFIFLPAGYRGPAWLAFNNFSVILKYNNAQNYALAVGYLGDRIRGKPALSAAWPLDDKPLSLTQKTELQQLLTVMGYSTEGVDGKIGPNTRSALRRWQMENGFPADGYATVEQLETLQRLTHSRSKLP